MSACKVIDLIVNNNLCTGCGLCLSRCSNQALRMTFNEYGFLEPKLVEPCNCNGDCIAVCPFNPFPDKAVKSEEELADIFLSNTPNQNERIGRYIGIYAGHAIDYRSTSSSGGLATYILTELLNSNEVDHVLTVKESKKQGEAYEYQICSTATEVLAASKTRYFPVTLGETFKKLKNLNGKVAIVGVACFIKGIRLAQRDDPHLREKIKFLVGIICGGIKSRFFTEYLATKAGVAAEDYRRPEYRIKDDSSTAMDYSFGCLDKKSSEQIIKMKTLGDMWGTGLFKANACDFCDDVTTELADVSLGDAWLSPFSADGRGTNVAVTRSRLADQLIQTGIKSKKLVLASLPLATFMASQRASFNHRQDALAFRQEHARRTHKLSPPKRFENQKISPIFKLIQILRQKTRRKSLQVWRETKNPKLFDKKMKIDLLLLKFLTRLRHYKTAAITKIRKSLKR